MKVLVQEDLPPEARAALAHFLKASACAEELKFDRWDLALRLLQLEKLGVSESDLRWLVLNGYVDQADDATTFRGSARRFRPSLNVAFTGETCFVLSAAGAVLAADLMGEAAFPSPDSLVEPTSSSLAVSIDTHPKWDDKIRTLWLGPDVVKRYRRPAGNQEIILSVFEEEGWPPSIDDPLPPAHEIDPKRRLNVALWRLNGRQQNRLLRFAGDGTGQGILWHRTALSGAGLKLRRAA